MEYYTVIKRNVLLYRKASMASKDIMLSEKRAFQKVTYYVIPFV